MRGEGQRCETQVHAQISDHAVLRYLERAYGMNIVAVREEMSAHLQPAIDFGASVVIAHGVRLVLRDGMYCVTALPRRGQGKMLTTRILGYRGSQVLAFIEETVEHRGRTPSYAEISDRLDIPRKKVPLIVKRLEHRGLVRRQPMTGARCRGRPSCERRAIVFVKGGLSPMSK